MSVAKELLDILVCPETKMEVHLAPDDLVTRLNIKISSGQLSNIGGDKVRDKIDSGLVRNDGKILYPIRQNIPIMLFEEGIDLNAA